MEAPTLSLSSTMDSSDQSTIPRPIDAGTGKIQNRQKQSSPQPSVDEESHPSPSDASQNEVAAAKNDAQWMTGNPLLVLLGLITTSMFLVMLDTSIIATAIPRITDELHSLEDVGWYVSIYQLASAAFQPLSGKIYHKFNNKFSMLAFLAVFEVGSVICGAASSSSMMIAGRAIAGIGSAGVISGGLTITASAMPLAIRVARMGAMMGFAQLGIAIGPLLGGAFTTYATWRWCFYINLPVGGLLAVGFLLIHVPDQSAKPNPSAVLQRLHRELDLLGFALIASATTQLLFALSWGGNQYAWDSAVIIGLFCGAGGTALLWLVWDWYRGDNALIPVSIIRVRGVWAGALTHCFFMTNVFCASFFLPMYFQAVRGADPMMSGVYVLASILSQLVVIPPTGKFVQRCGYIIPFALAAAIIGCISNGLYSTFSPTTSTGQWIGYQILNGVGRGVGMPLAVIAVQASLRQTDIALGNSIVMFAQSLGTAILLAVSNAIFQGALQSELPKNAPLADAAAITAAGATRFRDFVGERDLPGVLAAYSLAIDRVFYLAAGVSGLAVLTSLLLGWINIRGRQNAGGSVVELRDLGATGVVETTTTTTEENSCDRGMGSVV